MEFFSFILFFQFGRRATFPISTPVSSGSNAGFFRYQRRFLPVSMSISSNSNAGFFQYQRRFLPISTPTFYRSHIKTISGEDFATKN
jgi:hypothetical protein